MGFPGDSVHKKSACNAGDLGLIPGQGTKILHAMQCSQRKKKKQRRHLLVSPDFWTQWEERVGGENSIEIYTFSSVQSLSRVQLFATS